MRSDTSPPRRARIYEADDRIGVLYLAPWVDLGGSDKGTIDWFRGIDRTRFRPYLVTTQPSPNRWLQQIEPFAEEVWDLPGLVDGAAFAPFILGFVASRGVQVVHVMNSRIAFDLLVDLSLLPEPPVVVVQFHTEEPDRSGYVRYVSTRYGNLVDAFSVTSHHLAAAMADHDVPASRIEVITTGVDAGGEFDPAVVDPLPGVDRSRPAILWPGRLVEQKDPMLTLDVVAGLHARGHDFLVHVVGDGHLAPALRERARALGVEERLRWYPPSREMARWYASTDALLMTSVFEGVPYVVYEAFAMARPVVVPALPGNRELVDERSGWLVDPRDDVRAYVDALEAVVVDPAGARERGEHARRRMLAEHTLERMARGHEELYERLLARRRRTATVHDPAATEAEPPVPATAPLRLPRATLPERSIAVVVPCFQHGRYLPECLASVRRQTLPAAQVIVVDDASEDAETRAALDALEREDWLEVLRLERNSGPSVARNRALDRVTASYVLPLDADDKLFDDALEAMVGQLERAPDDVGFVYPNQQHFGNRHDLAEAPAYNLHLLLGENYCQTSSLFDRRVFDAGVRYGEDVLLMHEDWDLVLQLAERGVWGEPARGRTLLHRKRGFSRVDAVKHAEISRPDAFRRRHRRLYEQADRIKARWAPALSVVLLGDAPAQALAGLARQTSVDLELVAGEDVSVPDGLTVRRVAAGDVAGAIAAARGPWVLVVEAGALAAFADPAAVEKLMRAMLDEGSLPGITLAASQRPGTYGLRLLDGDEAAGLAPLAVLWARDPARRRERRVVLGAHERVIDDLAVALDADGRLQWRAVAGVPA